MREAWSIVMLIGGALFVAGVVPIAWEPAPAWRAEGDARFRVDFAHTLRRMDGLQPALVFVCLVSTPRRTSCSASPADSRRGLPSPST